MVIMLITYISFITQSYMMVELDKLYYNYTFPDDRYGSYVSMIIVPINLINIKFK